jgi:hypothetical protein
MITIDENDLELIFVCGKWRFVDHVNKLLSWGWFDVDECDITKVNFIKHYDLYKENYFDHIL